jgi:hypothetical protein
VKGFLLREWRIDEESKGTAGLQNWTVPRVLRQEWSQPLTMRLHAHSGAKRVIEKPYFHSRIVGHEIRNPKSEKLPRLHG